MPRKKTTGSQVSVGDEAPASEPAAGNQAARKQAVRKRASVKAGTKKGGARKAAARGAAAGKKTSSRGTQGASQLPRTAPTKGQLLYQFKITLLGIKPPIWRLIQVADGTLADLHNDIQAAFGWFDDHLHAFMIDGEHYGPAEFLDDGVDEEDARLSELISPDSRREIRWTYEYDFGDGWRHEILFEGYPPGEPKLKYPRCVAGKRACPPEDCGGPWRYGELVAALDDPDNPDNKELLEWLGPFDPEAFDIDQATKMMQALNSR